MLVHSVFFWLRPDLTPSQRAAFHRGLESLAAIKSAEKIYIGAPAATERRPVIDHTYSAALTILFKDVAAHDAYQSDPVHLAFVADCKPLWSRVQIYDAA